MIDGSFLPDHPLTLYKTGAFTPVPLITGFNANEGHCFVNMLEINTKEEARSTIQKLFRNLNMFSEPLSELERELVQLTFDLYIKDTADDRLLEVTGQVLGDALFVAPSYEVARLHSRKCNREWWVGGQAKWQSIEADNRLIVSSRRFPLLFNDVRKKPATIIHTYLISSD